MGVSFLAVSTDSHFVHKIWQEQELAKMVPGGVPFPMLSDPAGHFGRAYGVYDDGAGIDVRGRFLIDPDGLVQAIEMLTPPAGWRPGDPTLEPGPDLVGRVWEAWKPRKA